MLGRFRATIPNSLFFSILTNSLEVFSWFPFAGDVIPPANCHRSGRNNWATVGITKSFLARHPSSQGEDGCTRLEMMIFPMLLADLLKWWLKDS